jgi:acyl-coenzyme A synthetase/AMP-(fatty) acid ligase
VGIPATLPLWSGAPDRPILWQPSGSTSLEQFAQQVAALVAQLPAEGAMLNLCEDRRSFLIAYAAAASAGHTVLLPASRADQVVAELEAVHPDSYRCDDAVVARAVVARAATLSGAIHASHVVMVGFTSGSTGQPKAYPKLWRSVYGSNHCNALAIRAALREMGAASVATPAVVATVPPQHMYGMELSVLLPLIGGMAVHAARPLFPADIARALTEVPEPRVLVSTPVHLRTLVESDQPLPSVTVIVSATAPLDAELARAVEQRLGGRVLEMFGSTETCVFAWRYTAIQPHWTLYPGVELQPTAQGTWVNAPWFAAPVLLQDLIELQSPGTFTVRGRNADLIEVAGKRASLSDLTRRLLAVAGVQDAAVFQPEPGAIGVIRRVAAVVVAPELSAREVLRRLAPGVDPAFMPRPLLIVDALPRNELGKLPREQLLALLQRARSNAASGAASG